MPSFFRAPKAFSGQRTRDLLATQHHLCGLYRSANLDLPRSSGVLSATILSFGHFILNVPFCSEGEPYLRMRRTGLAGTNDVHFRWSLSANLGGRINCFLIAKFCEFEIHFRIVKRNPIVNEVCQSNLQASSPV